MVLRNDDELEQNWAVETVVDDGSDDALSAGSEDEFEDEDGDAELVTNKRPREEPSASTADKKQKVAAPAGETAVAKSRQPKPSKGLHKMTAAEHFKVVNDLYTKHRGGHMTSLELADGLNGAQ